jgi:hypothetical protein
MENVIIEIVSEVNKSFMERLNETKIIFSKIDKNIPI